MVEFALLSERHGITSLQASSAARAVLPSSSVRWTLSVFLSHSLTPKLNSFLSNVPFNESARRQKDVVRYEYPLTQLHFLKEDEDTIKRRNQAAHHKLVEVVHLFDARKWTPGSPIDASGLEYTASLLLRFSARLLCMDKSDQL